MPHAVEQLSPCATTIELCSAAAARSLQSCPTLCDPIDGSPPGSAIPGILQARTLEWVELAIDQKKKKKEYNSPRRINSINIVLFNDYQRNANYRNAKTSFIKLLK